MGPLPLQAVAAVVPAHVHIYVPASIGNLPFWLDVNGVFIAGLFAVQALSGYRRFKITSRQEFSLHGTVGWIILASAGVHAVLATVHLLIG